MTRVINCLNCGRCGEIEVRGLTDKTPKLCLFRYLGHNPLSGDMHFSCPACDLVLLVDPLAVLGDDAISAAPCPMARSKSIFA